ncbi:MAG TPA: thioesterase family protein [Terriglobia bacterium]|nr:thioesterase family protein [Terriglobia bacterium]
MPYAMTSGSSSPAEPDFPTSIDSWVSTEVRVRYAETDQMGLVYYANYLVWFEVGRAEFCRERGFAYRDFERENDAYLAVAEAQCRYRTPARYDDLLLIRTRVAEFRKRTIRFVYEVVRKNPQTLVATGSTLHVVLDSQGRPKSFPAAYRGYFR